jgi:hypothetical protein
MRFTEGENSFEVAPNYSLRALKELHIEFTAKPLEDRIDSASSVGSKATVIGNPAKD